MRRSLAIDRVFTGTLLLLLLIGLVAVYSACQGEDAGLGLDYWKKQIVFSAMDWSRNWRPSTSS